jgi:MFS family permease
MWLILQAFLATVGYGSLAWMPRLFIARLESAGYSLETATMSGNLFALLFQTGFYFAILAGHLGDRWQRRHPGGRAWFCAVTTWAAIPFQTALLFIPFHNLELPENGEIVAVVSATLVSILTNPWIAGAFMLGLVAVAFSSTDIPNRSAILTDVNLPEHRGTAVGLLSISVGLGLALGNALAGLSFDLFAPVLASPWHYAMSLALFQLLFIPAGLAYYQLSKTTMYDIARVKQTLAERAEII